jgi:hypothetical protein
VRGTAFAHRKGGRVGLSPAPDAARVRERIALLHRYRWSSYRAYVGLEPAPAWLECRTVLGLGGRTHGNPHRPYRDYAETAVREQVVLGGAGFLAGLKKYLGGDEQEQRGARRLLAERPVLAAVIGAIEQVKGIRHANCI